jgi:tRNA dimethylallyltransferase
MNKVIVITGPTAVGKTKLSIELAKRYNGEIINADAVQVYKGLDIGSAKVTEEEKEDIPHHLFDIKEVDEEYTIYHYQKDCRKLIKEVQGRGKTPILVGGTGLYIKAALYDYKLTEEKETNTYDNLTDEELYNKLLEVDKDIVIDKNDLCIIRGGFSDRYNNYYNSQPGQGAYSSVNIIVLPERTKRKQLS